LFCFIIVLFIYISFDSQSSVLSVAIDKNKAKKFEKFLNLCIVYLILLLLVAICIYFPCVYELFELTGLKIIFYNEVFMATLLIYVIKISLVFFALLSICCLRYYKRVTIGYEYCIFILLSVFIACFMISTKSLLLIFVFMEMQALIFYVLVSMYNNN